ncbi:hypothetical protein [Sporomusa acidovorans]|uniref:Uncharacterized protein n=1 Tax=Sporomusa acidovorans (strain ATCC 49682 / DSM 3132 / Mol) TaxID=1123286 RepID=A0ABZ3IXZ6_SPOA4|nr:hypothetical protein [Sporomusa acidovorans]OZC22183.1 hypothetical protein SPACI_15340 [Sporomusa acidovorans DSM 3132]SDE82002.1 hypothetical protein SAMN04488499_102259 [Sporomusa acidovorans]
MLILCKGSTTNANPVNITNRFLASDELLVAIAILDEFKYKQPINIRIVWTHLETNIRIKQIMNAAIFDKSCSCHRLATYIKMAVIERKNYTVYGKQHYL